MVKIVKSENCKGCGKSLREDKDSYYACDSCGNPICESCAKHEKGKDLCGDCTTKSDAAVTSTPVEEKKSDDAVISTPVEEKRSDATVTSTPVEEKRPDIVVTSAPTEGKKSIKIPSGYVKIGAIVIILLAIAVVLWQVPSPSSVGYTTLVNAPLVNNYDANPDAPVTVELFVMSQCPFGVKAENALMPVLEEFDSDVNFELHYIAREAPGGTFNSLHGQPEVTANIRQLCVIKHYPEKFFDYLTCVNKDYANINVIAEGCLSEVGIDINKLTECATGEEGTALLREDITKANEYGVTGSPSFYINGEAYTGGRDEAALTRAICEHIPDAELCANIEPPKEVNLVILNDNRCGGECDVGRMVNQLKGMFPGLNVETLDYGSDDGKALYDELGIKFLPALLFDKSVVEAGGYRDIQSYFRPMGDYLFLNVGSSFDPSAEICDNGVDDNKDGKTDCEDSTCSSNFVCMQKKEKPEVELFVMSHCPFGTQIEKGMIPVVELLGDKIDFSVKFCNYAMHGKKEIDEQLVQHCIQEEQNELYLDYLKCFLEAEDKGEACLAEAGIDTTMLDACIESTDEELKITHNFNDQNTWISGRFPRFDVYNADNEKYGIQGSPGLVINGVVAEGVSRDSASLLDAICLGFDEKPAECGETLSGASPSAGFGFATASAGAPAPAGSCG